MIRYALSLLLIAGFLYSPSKAAKAKKLYWFIPDGMRADPYLFNIFQWAREGKLPNIKKMMDNGTYGFCIPVFPSHTPVNFATLLTGSYPKTHGIADGPMHIEGRPLDKVAIGGFSSVAKKVPPIWMTLEENHKKVVLLSIPGSTPPELNEGITIRGRWGGWGADFYALNFQSKGDLSVRKKQGRSSRLFFFGPELTRYAGLKEAYGWEKCPESFSTALEAVFSGWGVDMFMYLYDSSDDSKCNYDRIAFSYDKKNIIADIAEGDWSRWIPADLKWQGKEVASDLKLRIIKLNIDKLKDNGFFRVRCLYNNLNRYICEPPEVAEEIVENTGPMVDFVDNFPPQLIYYPEDKQVFIEEADMSLLWHKNTAAFIHRNYKPAIFIHDIYTPNQMLTSRWWMGYIDPQSDRYNDVNEDQRNLLWEEVLRMYKKLDDILGEDLDNADDDTLVVLSSDHGSVPLNTWVNLNNLFAREGLLKFKVNEETGEPVIDWHNTKVIYLKMDNIYISPDGLDGDWHRSKGREYNKLRNRVIELLNGIKDENGKNPVASVVKWEDVGGYWDLPEDRVGDLIVANEAGFGWNEEVAAGMEVFTKPLKTGYKQAVLPGETKAMWTPFIIMGPGVKKNNELKEPVSIVDQYPTIMRLLGIDSPDFVEGHEIKKVFE